MPHPEGPLGTGLPADVGQGELRAWVEGRTSLHDAARLKWDEDAVADMRILSAHHEEQLQGACAELSELGQLAEQEYDAPAVEQLQTRIRSGEYELSQADLALALAEQRLTTLRSHD